ncbi:hypothetical protein HAX54_010593 [Datura stramonium]|uniref:Mannosyltransferase n=1 Tax=Datura stramonium TaxID=4076 RepID=A0ABS8TJ90_DATST|nr:hypothetical protein [Datura stramonium]
MSLFNFKKQRISLNEIPQTVQNDRKSPFSTKSRSAKRRNTKIELRKIQKFLEEKGSLSSEIVMATTGRDRLCRRILRNLTSSSAYTKLDKPGEIGHSQFGLRSYLYILLHKLVGLPASWWFREEKVRVFLCCENFSCVAVCHQRCCSSCSPFRSFLPSSFSMYAMSLSSALFLFNKPAMAVSVAATGVFWAGRFRSNFSSTYNLLTAILPIAKKKYAPELFVVVSPVYLWIAFMSLQPHKEERFLYPIYPLICVAVTVIESFPDLFRDKYNPNDNKFLRPLVLGLILCASHARTFSLINGYSAPVRFTSIWTIMMTLEPVERLIQEVVEEEHQDSLERRSLSSLSSTVVCFWLCSCFSIYSILARCGAFMVLSFALVVSGTDSLLHSSFLIMWAKFDGWMMDSRGFFQFHSILVWDDLQLRLVIMLQLRDPEQCTFLIRAAFTALSYASDMSTWEIVAALPYLDRELSPPMYRSFFIPYQWQQKNVFGQYRLLRRLQK